MNKGSGDVLMGLIENSFNVIGEGGFNVGGKRVSPLFGGETLNR